MQDFSLLIWAEDGFYGQSESLIDEITLLMWSFLIRRGVLLSDPERAGVIVACGAMRSAAWPTCFKPMWRSPRQLPGIFLLVAPHRSGETSAPCYFDVIVE